MKYNLLITSGRQSGKTTAICKAAKEIGAVVLTHNDAEAKRLIKAYGVEARSLKTIDKLLGLNKPLLVDPNAAGMELNDLDMELNALEFRNETLLSLLRSAYGYVKAHEHEGLTKNLLLDMEKVIK